MKKQENNETFKNINEDDYLLYLDDIGTLWVLDKNETIHDLNYDTVENYAEGDILTVNIEALFYTYSSIQAHKLYKQRLAAFIVNSLREECLKGHRVLHYAQQLAKVKYL